jgi:golgin subfamily B member 1
VNPSLSAPTLDDQIRTHLETLEAAPGDLQAFSALETIYEKAARWEDLVVLYESRARLVADPGAAPPLLAKAANVAHRKLRNVARAEELYRLLLRTEPGDRAALRELAELCEQRGDWAGLAAALEREVAATDDAREAARLAFQLGRVQEDRLGRRDRATLQYARACKLDPAHADARARALDGLMALRRFAQAKRLLDAARDAGAQARPLAADYARLATVVAEEPLEHPLAMDAVIEALALDRSAPGAAAIRERLKETPRRWRDEVGALEAEASRAPDRRTAAALHLRVAQLFAAYDPDGPARVVDRIERAWALAPGVIPALELLGRTFGDRNDWRGAADVLARLAAGTRDRAALVAIHLELAQLDLIRFGDRASALAALERALALDPANETAALQAFEGHLDAGREEDALAVLERHLAATPEKAAHAPLRVRAAEIARDRLGDPVRARRHLDAALRADPGHPPAAAALAPLLAEAREWARLVEILELRVLAERDVAERVKGLERIAEVLVDQLDRPREALRILCRALALEPTRALTRKAMEGAAARAGAFLELARAYRAAADAIPDDLKAKKLLLRRVAEIFDRDLEQPAEAVRAYRALVRIDPGDKGASAALEACLARAGQHEEVARGLEERVARTTGAERRDAVAKLARLWAEASQPARAAEGWRQILAETPEDLDALWGLHAALEPLPGAPASIERAGVLARLALQAHGPAERAALELERAELLEEPLSRLGEAAGAALAVLSGGGFTPSQGAQAAALLERLVVRGVEPLRIAQTLAPMFAAQGDGEKQAAMLELLAQSLPAEADPRERARHLLDAAAVRAERLADPRGALSAAAAALRACPDHREARQRCEALALEVGAHAELYTLLVEAAHALESRARGQGPAATGAGGPGDVRSPHVDERTLRLRAAAIAEEELGSSEDAAAQLRRCLALSPEDGEALAALTRVALASERWDEAADLLARRTTSASGTERAALLGQLADVLLEGLGDATAAADALREALATATAEAKPRLLARLAVALGAAGDVAGQAEALGALAASGVDPAEAARASIERARLVAGLGDERGAAEALAAGLARNPEDAATLAALEAHLAGGDPAAALVAAGALAAAHARCGDVRKRIHALEVEARLHPEPAGRAAAGRAVAALYAGELGQASLAFAALADAARATPEDAALRQELRRLADETDDAERCAREYEALVAAAPPDARPAILREQAELLERRLGDHASAIAIWEGLRADAPGDADVLAALRRLHRAGGDWAALAAVDEDLGARGSVPAARLDALREGAVIAEERLEDVARAARIWEAVAALAPDDAGALAALERLHERLDRPDALAQLLERRLAAGFDAATAERLAELRRTRLGDPAGTLALLGDLLRREPARPGLVDALVLLAETPGTAGREALGAADAALRAENAHARRVAMREARLAAAEPVERARLYAEIRDVYERELDEPGMAFLAACRAFAEGGAARAEAEDDVVRLARATGSLDELADVYEAAAAGAPGDVAADLLRRAARVREGEVKDRPAAIAAWKRVLDLLPDDGEALEALARLYSATSSARELLDVARRRAALAQGAGRTALLLEVARLAEALGDAEVALDALREARAANAESLEVLEALDRALERAGRAEEHAEVLFALGEAVRDAEPARRIATLVRRAAVLEEAADVRAPIEAYAVVLAESGREPGAVAGLERLLARPETREAAARLLEDVFRLGGDARRLAGLLEIRLETADGAERSPLLAELAALHERLGDKRRAFEARLRGWRDGVNAGRDELAARADTERLAIEAGALDVLAGAYEDALDSRVPKTARDVLVRRLGAIQERLGRLDEAARRFEEAAANAPALDVLGALARVYRKSNRPRELADALGRLAAATPAAVGKKELLLEVARIMDEQLSDREGAIEAYRKILQVDPEDPNALRLLGRLLGSSERWEDLVEVLAREVNLADRGPNLVAEAAELRFRLGRIRHQRLADEAGALACYREVLAKVPRHPAALAALEDLARASGPAAVQAAMLLEPIYTAEGEHQKVIETLEARASNEGDPAMRSALLRRVTAVYGGPLRNAEMAFLAASRAFAADPDSGESLALAAHHAQAATLPEELASVVAENVDRITDPAVRAEAFRVLARLFAASEPARAADAWARLLDLVADDREALAGLTAALRAGPDAEALAQALRRALAIEEDAAARSALLAELAQVLEERLGDLPGAIATLKRYLEGDASSREALARLDRLCVRTERWVELGDALAREISAADAAHDWAAAITLRYRLAELKEARLLDREGALALYEEVLVARPDHPESIARLEAMLQKDPSNAQAAIALENAYAAVGAWQKQAAVLEIRAGEQPDPLERKALWLALGVLRETKLGDPELAFLATCKAFREDPGDRAVRERLEALAGKSEHHEELAAIYEDELDRLPPGDLGEVALTLGHLYEDRLGGPAEAVDFYRRALAIDPAAGPAALAALERIHQRTESWDALAEVLQAQADAATGPDRVGLLFRLGQLSVERLGAPEQAALAYEAAVAEDPRHLPSLRALEALYEAAARDEDLLQNLAVQRAATADAATRDPSTSGALRGPSAQGERDRVLVKMGGLAASLGHLDDAVGLWKELLSQKPRHEAALAALEELYERLERWPELAQHLRLRVQATVDRREVARLNDKLGVVLGTKLGDPTQAIQSFKAVLDSDPRNRKALEALREIYAAQGDQDGLASALRRLIPLQEDAAGVKRVRIELAEVLLRGSQKSEAIEQAKRAFDIEPHGAEELVRLEDLFRAAGAATEAVRAAEARAVLLAAQGGPAEAVPAWLAVADLWRQHRRPDAAAAALEKVLELDPANRTAYDGLRELHAAASNWRAYAHVCDLYGPHLVDPAERVAVLKEVAAIHEKKLGQKEMAFLSVCRVLAEAPADAESLADAERLAAESEGWEELADVLENVGERTKGIVRAKLLLKLGRVRDEKLDDLEGAESAFRRALEADPASPEGLDALTALFKRRGRVRDLVIALEQKLEAAAGLDEKKATLLEVAKIYDGELHDVDEAVAALRRVLELDGGDAAASETLSAILRREARWTELSSVLARARDLAPTDPARLAFQLKLAGLFENELADEEAAVDAYRAALGADDRNETALAGLERLYTKLDRFAELNRVYERQIQLAADPREQVRILAKSAGIFEEKLHDLPQAIERHEAILRVDGGNVGAVKELERLYRAERLWDRLISVMQHHLSLVSDRRETVALEVAIGEVWYREMSRVDRAEAIFNHALQLDPDSREAVSALGRLYERSGNWNLALDMLKREARIAGASREAVDVHVRMGAIQEDMLLDIASAKEAYARAIQIDPGSLPAIRALKGIAERERDRDGYLEALVAEARYAETDAAKAHLFAQVGRVYQEERDDREAAARAYEEALRHDGDHLVAAQPLADLYVGKGEWESAERVLEGVVRTLATGGDAKELCRQSYRLGYVAEKLGKSDKALVEYRRAYELDATYLPALEGLGNLLVKEELWEEALKIYTSILIHHRDGLTDLEVVEIHWQIGEIAAKLGQWERAANSWRKALELDVNHEPSRRSLVGALEGMGDWEGAVEQRQRLLPLLDEPARFETYVAIGQACRDRLKDAYQAIDAYLGAAKIDPTSLPVTEALLGLYRETRQGQKAADVLAQLLARNEVKSDRARLAKLHLARAEILRDEVKDEEAALAALEAALDANPRLVKAFAAIEELLTKGRRWSELEGAYVRMIHRLPKTPEVAQARLALWKTLGELYRNVLANDDGARTAYQVVAKADPDDAVSIEVYADLCAAKPGHEADAIAAYRQLLRAGAKPQKGASALVGLHAARKEYDLAYSAAQVLAYVVGAASAEEQQVVTKLRRWARDQASRPMDEALWQLTLHDRVKGPLAAIMTLLALHARPMFVQSPKDLGLNPKKDELDVEGSMLFFVNMFKYVARTLGLSGVRLFRSSDAGRLQLVPTDPPGVVAGEDLFHERPKKELWFTIGRALAFRRPELFVARLMPHDQLEAVFQAACSLGTSRFVVTADPHLVEKLKVQLEKVLPENLRKNGLKLLARQYCDVQHPGDVRAYMDGAELTSNRVGMLLAGDMEIARKGVIVDKAQVSKLRDDTRIKDLALFGVSEEYAQLRERLGLAVVVPG